MSLHTKPTERSKPLGRFKQALIASNKLSIIAEVKRRSPSRGNLNTALDPAQLAVAYRDGGAVCLSVLTNQAMFGGNSNDLRTAATASGLPVLRKDFITTTQDVYESQEMGADAILLIVADLANPAPSDPDLKELHSLALSLGMDVLVEVKSPDELDLALAANAEIIGVNQRAKPKSQAYTMDFQRAQQMAPLLPNNVVKVAESGIGVAGGTTIDAVRQAGYDAALIGEALVTADNPVLLLQEFLA
ncbi:MAG: indole-3-glycerol-phosphate synthase [bacterium]|nr:indole-3-glycerol-phosphate synthase [bacterium]